MRVDGRRFNRNITSDSSQQFSSKRKKAENVEQNYSTIKDLSKNCSFRAAEEVFMQNILVTRTFELDMQRNIFAKLSNRSLQMHSTRKLVNSPTKINGASHSSVFAFQKIKWFLSSN